MKMPKMEELKAQWGDGPWQHEPDEDHWVDTATGLACAAKRNHAGAWCGYVQIPARHPLVVGCGWANKSGCRCEELEVHGGITMHNAERSKTMGLKGTLVGFDCAHYDDIVPALRSWMAELPASAVESHTYRTLEFVKTEVTQLASQVAQMGSAGKKPASKRRSSTG